MLTFDFIKTHTHATCINSELLESRAEVSSVDFDTRRLTKNSLYIALTIGNTDGHSYIEQALNRGAVAVLISDERFVKKEWHKQAVFFLVEDSLHAFQELARAYRRQLNVPVIGITGSNGKTTSKDMVSSLLGSKLSVHKTYKNFNNHLGVPLTLLQAKPSHDVMVLEMGMNHAGELDRLGEISEPNYVVITNIGESHIEYLGSRENIAHAKGELLPHLRTGGTAFLPADSEFLSILSGKTSENKVLFGLKQDEKNDGTSTCITAETIQLDEGYTTFSCNKLPYAIPLYGEHNVRNALPAICLAKEMGFSALDIQEGLKHLSISPMRFERLQGKNNTILINDAYNASPTSMQKSSKTFLDTFSAKRRVLVLGDMYELGAESEDWHRNVGTSLNDQAEEVEFLVTVGVHAQAISAVFKGRSRHFTSKEEASRFLQFFLHEDFAFFFKASRGMKLETITDTLQ